MRQLAAFIVQLAFAILVFPLANDEGFDYTAIDIMKIIRELARLAKNAVLTGLGLVGLRRWGRAAMSIYALDILAATSILTRCHARDQTKCCYLRLSWLVVMPVVK